ncbi:MAG: bifunctional DNA primase/polymerase [Candidatus Brocadiia bacterium]|jgi:hypothetical protein
MRTARCEPATVTVTLSKRSAQWVTSGGLLPAEYRLGLRGFARRLNQLESQMNYVVQSWVSYYNTERRSPVFVRRHRETTNAPESQPRRDQGLSDSELNGHLRDAALRYAEMDFRVFPCIPRTKKPLTPRGFQNATTDQKQIETWWPHAAPRRPRPPTESRATI